MSLFDSLSSDGGLSIIRSLARLVFALITVGYLYWQMDATTTSLLWPLLFLASYLVVHGLLLWRAGEFAEEGGLLADIAAVSVAILLDPAQTPPTLLLFLVVSVSGGMLGGGNRFLLLTSLSALVIAGLAAAGKFNQSPSVLFLLLLMLVMALYVGTLLFRSKLVAHQHREATWKDPETGLISRQAMLATGAWLLPLHDRLGSSLTLAMLTPEQDSDVQALADQVAQRLRRSDVAARYDDEVLAVILPSTSLTAAENLLEDLRESSVGFYAALLTVSEARHGMDLLFRHLEKHLERAREETLPGRLAHAPPLQ